MNAERLHAICLEVKKAIRSATLVNHINDIVNILDRVVNNPRDPNLQQSLSGQLDKLYVVLTDFPTDKFSPAWRQALDELGGSDILGERLKDRLKLIFERNQITPATALKEVQQINKELQEFNNAVENVANSFQHIGIGAEELEPGECELGVLVPREAVNNSIKEFSEELKDLNFVFGTFSELASGKRETFKIKSLSSSDFTIFLAAIPPVAACIAHAVEKIVTIYKTLLEIKKHKAELKQLGLKEDNLKGISEHANSLMKDELEKLTIELVKEYHIGSDGNRKNELENSIRISLNMLANRVDKGFNIEVRAEPLEGTSKDAQESEEEEQIRKYINRVISAQETLQFIKMEGEPLLSLPENNAESKTSSKKKDSEK